MSEGRRERIIDATVELADEGGFEAVRLRDVASASGVALGTVYRNFTSKEDLLVGVAHVMGGHDVRMVEFGQRPGFRQQRLLLADIGRVQHLERNLAI